MSELWLLGMAAAGVAALLYGRGVGLNRLVAGWRRQAGPVNAPAGELGEAQLREEVERAWAEVSSFIDRIIGSGRMLDRDVLLDLARFLESAMPAVAAYERLVARAYEQAVADAGVTALPLPAGER